MHSGPVEVCHLVHLFVSFYDVSFIGTYEQVNATLCLSERAVAVVVDPIQSVKGKVVIDAFRLINPNMMVLGQEPRQTTSNLGHLQKPSIQVPHHVHTVNVNALLIF